MELTTSTSVMISQILIVVVALAYLVELRKLRKTLEKTMSSLEKAIK